MNLLRLVYRNLRSKPERSGPMAAGVFLLVLSVLYSFGSMQGLLQLRRSSLRDLATHQAQIIVIPRYAQRTGLRQSFQTLTALMEETRHIQGVARVDQLTQFLSAALDDTAIHFAAVIPDPRALDGSGAEADPFDLLVSPGSALLRSALTGYPADGSFEFAGFAFNAVGVRSETATIADRTVFISCETARTFLESIERTGGADMLEKENEQSLIIKVHETEDPFEVSTRILRDVKTYIFLTGTLSSRVKTTAWRPFIDPP